MISKLKNKIIKKKDNNELKKNSLKFKILSSIMNYSLFIGFILGFIAILFGVFIDLFLPITIFAMLFGTLNAIFVIRNPQEEFRFFLSMIAALLLVTLVITYIRGMQGYIEISREGLKVIFDIISHMLSLLVALFIIPCIKSTISLVFMNKSLNSKE